MLNILSRLKTPTRELNSDLVTFHKASNLSGRCPVLIKTSITHKHNTGESKEGIIAGLLDVITDNLLAGLKLDSKINILMLTGRVSNIRRIRNNINSFCLSHSIMLLEENEDHYYIDAIGCAVTAAEKGMSQIIPDNIFSNIRKNGWNKTAPLKQFLQNVERKEISKEKNRSNAVSKIIAGLDIGSTGSKLVILDYGTKNILYEDYTKTSGEPIAAVKELLAKAISVTNEINKLSMLAVTGSGRILIGTMLKNIFGENNVYIVNEIIAHTAGALHYDETVDTIFEIGGQDSKYIRISNGAIIDFALNEACSAGTGSFLEELCSRFPDYFDFKKLDELALSAEYGIELGQHCSVFISDVIEKAVAANFTKESIAVGLFDSIIANYMNRVKKNRSIGSKIFCQGMPFSMASLGCAVARYTGGRIVIPAHPGTVGALGAALLAGRMLPDSVSNNIDVRLIFNINQIRKEEFICNSIKGCSPVRLKCSIEKVSFKYDDEHHECYWGGSCSLWEKNRGADISTGSIDPFAERSSLIESIKNGLKYDKRLKSIGITDKFSLHELFPFFTSLFSNLGINVITENDQSNISITKGKRDANIVMCSPALQGIGAINLFNDKKPDYIFNPVFINSLNYYEDRSTSSCPIVQGNAYLIKNSKSEVHYPALISPVIKIGRGDINSAEFYDSCKSIGKLLGKNRREIEGAFNTAVKAQEKFSRECKKIGDAAINYCKEHNKIPIVVLGKLYSIHHQYLNSNVPNYLRSLGIVPIPMDCFSLAKELPDFSSVYWGYAQYILAASFQIRSSEQIFSVLCTNYSCGPDSFVESYYNYIMKGKPSLVIENDGDAGNVGTKMRLEILLHCIKEYMVKSNKRVNNDIANVFKRSRLKLLHLRNTNDKILLPYIGYSSNVVAAVVRGSGIACEALPKPNNQSLALGKRFTSGKECLPMSVTLGSLLHYIKSNDTKNGQNKLFYFMPGSEGPCRFGNYNILDRLVIKDFGLEDRVLILSSADDDLFDGMPASFTAMVYLSLISIDNLVAAANYVRQIESRKGETDKVFQRYYSLLVEFLENTNCFQISNGRLLSEVISGNLFGLAKLFQKAAAEFSLLKTDKKVKTVSLDGALYVRLDPFSNQDMAQKLEERGLRIKEVPFTEWLDFLNLSSEDGAGKLVPKKMLNKYVKYRIRKIPNMIFSKELGMPNFPELKNEIEEITRYIGFDSIGEAILSVGGSIVQHKAGKVDALMNLGPSECLQCKVADSIIKNALCKNNILAKSIEFNGDIMDESIIDDFVYDIENYSHNKAWNGLDKS
ncbi:MAG: hypothetical protein KF816_02170 [Melioribacteraceae bacterium]|nr:hypothetical protein [Melioribacteraceae bacterium]